MSYEISEIFESIDGEGLYQGYRVLFIRLYGCNLRCSWCDTKYSYNNNDFKKYSLNDLLKTISTYSIKKIVLTGGEPLKNNNIYNLIFELKKKEYDVIIYTNGTINFNEKIKLTDNIILDYKLYINYPIQKLRYFDVLKFVIRDYSDMMKSLKLIEMYKPICNIYFSPCYGLIDPKEISEFIIKNKIDNIKLQLQIHKYIWDVDKRGV